MPNSSAVSNFMCSDFNNKEDSDGDKVHRQSLVLNLPAIDEGAEDLQSSYED